MSSVSVPFRERKEKILSDLSVPDEEYSDLSPKGSVDLNIRPLIHDINDLPGLATTSSCAGRISVFLEGGWFPKPETEHTGLDFPRKETRKEIRQSTESDVPEAGEHDGKAKPSQDQFAPTGGKGSGKWLFVSHDPVVISNKKNEVCGNDDKSAHEILGLTHGDGNIDPRNNTEQLRLVRFHFEPMILHVMCSSLHHAQPVLSAASSSGFRESGLQSLRCLSDSSAHPIAAIRSAGLSLESVIGYYSHSHGCVRSLVSEDYLRLLVALANERFKVNAERMERFRGKLTRLTKGDREDPDVRRERKRAEGLARKADIRKSSSNSDSDDDLTLGCLEG